MACNYYPGVNEAITEVREVIVTGGLDLLYLWWDGIILPCCDKESGHQSEVCEVLALTSNRPRNEQLILASVSHLDIDIA